MPQSGNYSLTFRFANGASAPRPAQLSIDGTLVTELNFASTDSWSNWQNQKATLPLAAGAQHIALTANSSAGLANIDSLTLAGASTIAVGTCPAQPPRTVWLAGDSTVANGQTPCPVGWGKTFAEFFNEKITVQNYAAGGRSVRTWLYDITSEMDSRGECIAQTDGSGNPIIQARWQSMQEAIQAGDYLMIQFGINDGSRTCPRHVGVNQFIEEYRMMAQTALDKGAHPIFLTPAPAVICSGSTAVANRGFVQAVFDIGNQLNIPVIDLHQLGIQHYNQKGFCPVEGGDVSATTGGEVGAFFCNDHTHFDYDGARAIGKLITDALTAQYIPLADYLK